jgi:uncharacterized protein
MGRARRLLATVFALAVLGACGGDDATFHSSLDHLDRGTVTLARADDGERIEVAVTLPRTGEEFRRGLMEVPVLAEGTGMLFDFGEERHGGFWMKDTLVPLDIAFAAGDGEVLAVLAMEPCEAEPCPSYNPGVAYRYALEVPQGWFDANELGPGDQLEVVGVEG